MDIINNHYGYYASTITDRIKLTVLTGEVTYTRNLSERSRLYKDKSP